MLMDSHRHTWILIDIHRVSLIYTRNAQNIYNINIYIYIPKNREKDYTYLTKGLEIHETREERNDFH